MLVKEVDICDIDNMTMYVKMSSVHLFGKSVANLPLV